ncbi:MAG TPA: ATP-binding protein [Lacipirellulaceae bacterium]|nr:ATP-binding protein [Lacipirellulaceae bacterium]
MLAPFRIRGFRPYVVGIAGVVVASSLRLLFDPYLGEHLSFSFDYLAVFVAAWIGGVWPAVFTAIVSSIVSNYLFTDPYLSLRINSIEEFFDMTFFLIVSMIIGVLSEVSVRALARAKKAEEEKDNFVATVAHELRSPIAAIYYANSLNRVAPTDQPSEQTDVIDRQVSHLNLLIDDLLDVSRVARGKVRLNRQYVDASAIIDEAIEQAQPLITRRGHSLKLDVSPDPMPLYVDPVRVEQVVANLLTNAAKYTHEGGQISVRVRPIGHSVELSVRDNGVGIPPDMLPRIFDLFVQGEHDGDPDNRGLGIGLALARKISEMHGGTISAVSSGPNQGSEFTVRLPHCRTQRISTPLTPTSVSAK